MTDPTDICERYGIRDSLKPLSPRQELFAQARAAGKTEREARIAAGYSVRSKKSICSQHPNVLARIDQLLAEAAARAVISTEDITALLQEVIARCKRGTAPVMLNMIRQAAMDLAKVNGLLDGKGGPKVKICDCGGANRIIEMRRVLVRPDGSERDLPTIPKWPEGRPRKPGD